MRKLPASVTRPVFSWLDLAGIIPAISLVGLLPQHIVNWVAAAVWIGIAFCAAWRFLRHRRQPKGTP